MKISSEIDHMASNPYQPILTLKRADTIESIHYGAFAVVDSNGRLIASHGDPETITYLRSSSKPFQALPLVESGGTTYWGFTPKEIAITCASHAGTDDHAQTLLDIQAKIGITQQHLQCGVHPPMDKETANNLILKGEQPTPNRHNCSGKHTGMLAFAQANNLPLKSYLDLQHPLQQKILRTICDMCDLEPEQVEIGIDGCSAPNFAMPLRNAAFGFARLIDPWELPPKRAASCQIITDAMISHPDMVAGPGRFDTLLMVAAHGKVVSKGGAEGYQAIAIKPGVIGSQSPGIGIAIKISDGDPSSRARSAVALQILIQLGALTSQEAQSLEEFGPNFLIHNWRDILVGQAETIFQLDDPH
jgi:L-asparaginase II